MTQNIETMKGLTPNMGREYYSISASPSNLQGPVSKSLLWSFSKSPFKWLNGKEFEATEKMKFGSLIHSMCFSPSQLESDYAASPFDDWRTKEAKDWRQEKEAGGAEIVKKSDWIRAEEMKDAIMESDYIQSLGACAHEVAAFGQIGGTKIKGMMDILPLSGNKIVDLKTTGSIGDEKELTRHLWNLGYHWQAALYLDLVNGLTGQNRTEFEFLFVEDCYPYEMAVVGLSEAFIQKGREGYMKAVAKWQEAISLKRFLPSHHKPLLLDPPVWA